MQDNKLEKNRKTNFLLNKIYHLIFGEKFLKKINFNFDKRSRLDLINDMIKKKNYKKYLEIGCHNNEVFDEIEIDKIGIDPISGGNFRGTSDEFFEKNQKTFDCIFIDGLHEYKQVNKDIVNSIKFLNKDGIIILHDCLPPSISHQRVSRTRYTWKGIVEARTWEYVDTYTVLADQGLGIIKKENNTDILKIKGVSFQKLKFSYFYENHSKIMRTISCNDFLNII